MRLLHASTHKLHDHPPDKIPPYAILSHTWGDSSYEVSYADIQAAAPASYTARPGWQKIVSTCAQALCDGLEWAWVDTCCIDKSSSAELSEAINSMFAWYRDAAACYAYLVDVRDDVGGLSHATLGLALGDSRWFTRGWCLQELIAPAEVQFYATDWSFIGSRTQLAGRISAVTGIKKRILDGSVPFRSACIAQRMFWVSRRQTTRPEDLAYCMMGLFDINMPTLYGEGEKAFVRLQEEILRTSDDHSLFAWIDEGAREDATSGLLATSPAMFRYSGNVVSFRDWTEPSLPFSMSNSGLSITLPMDQDPATTPARPSTSYRAYLNCAWSSDRSGRVFVQLQQIGNITQQYCRTDLWSSLQSRDFASRPKVVRQIFVRQSPALPQPQDIVPAQPFAIELHRTSLGDISTDYALRAYLHDGTAIQNKNWWPSLMRQAAFNGEDCSNPIFYMPGQPRQLALVLLMEYVPTLSKFFIMLGSGHNSHYPMFDYRVLRPSDHVLYNDIQHFLRSTRFGPGAETYTYAARLDRNFASKRMAKVRDWLDQFRNVYDPLLRANDPGGGHGRLFDASSTDSFCSMIGMMGVDHHVQMTRAEGDADGVGKIMLKLRIGGHRWKTSEKVQGKDEEFSGKEREWDACSQSVASIFD